MKKMQDVYKRQGFNSTLCTVEPTGILRIGNELPTLIGELTPDWV